MTICGPTALAANAQTANAGTDLSNLSIEDLGKIDIISVSRSPEPLSDAPAAVYVITRDDIIRSGAQTIPEMLRLAPNLQVAQINASSYAITARGFNGGANASFSDKLLILIDGRSVYSPLFAGVYWDAQYVPPENIERIEVISGPGSTLWGANAVNGVINIITRKSGDTPGGMLDLGGGNLQRNGFLQYGGKAGDGLTYRVYASELDFASSETNTGHSADDRWNRPQGGFRLDWNPAGDAIMLEGDSYHAWENQPGAPILQIGGTNLVGRWTHPFANGSSLQVLAYWDQTFRFTPDGGGGFLLDTYDLELQHSFRLGSWNQIVWGVGERVHHYGITNLTELLYVPWSRTLNLADVFAQDTIALARTVNLILGAKVENDPFSGVSFMPNARLSWKPLDNVLLWSAVSRAVRAPTPFDTDIEEKIGAIDFLNGNPDFRPEKLTAYEVGTRFQPTPRSSVSLSAFYNVYDDLRSIELNPDGLILPLVWGNMMAGHTYGLEGWGDYRVLDWWKLAFGFSLLHENLHFKPGSTGFGGLQIAGDDPPYQAQLHSTVNITDTITWEAGLRAVGPLPNPAVPGYGEFDTRIAWAATPDLELSLAGFNLLHAEHVEFTTMPPFAVEVGRSFYLQARVRF